jgi:hypothetical protein
VTPTLAEIAWMLLWMLLLCILLGATGLFGVLLGAAGSWWACRWHASRNRAPLDVVNDDLAERRELVRARQRRP